MPQSEVTNGGLFTCEKCSCELASQEARRYHVRNKHQEVAKCVVYDVGNHPITHLIKRVEGVFKCPQCKYSSSDPKLLRQHTKSCKISPQNDRNLSAKMCNPATMVHEIGIEYNRKLGLVICAICRYVLSPGVKEVAIHFKRAHDVTVPAKLLEKKFDVLSFATGASLLKYLKPTQDLLELVDGIEIKSGVRCLHCAYFCPLEDTMSRHLRSKHNDFTTDVSQLQCLVQSLYSGAKTKYFGVQGGASFSTHADCSDAVDRALNEFSRSHLHIAPTDDRLVPPFLRRMKWHEVVRTYCTDKVSEAIASVKFDPNSNFVELVFPVVCRYWELSQEIIGTREYLLERILSSKGSDIEPASALRRIQSSSEKYCKTLTSLLQMVNTHAKHYIITSSSSTDDVLVDQVDSLFQSCSEAFASISTEHYRAEHVCVEQLELLDGALEKIFRIDLENEHSPSEFHAFPTHRFVVCSSISGPTKDAAGYVQFKQPGQVTSLVAILKYWARIAALMNLHQLSWGVEANEQNLATRKRAEALRFYLRTGYRTPFNLLQEVISFGSSIAMAPEQRRIPQIMWLGSAHDALLVEGHRVTLKTLHDLKAKLIDQFGKMLRENVLLGYDISAVEKHLMSDEQCCYDDYSNYSCGYSFLEDDRNPWKPMRMHLVKYLLQTHRSKFIVKVVDGKITFGLASLSQWCKKVDKLTKLLAPLIYITSGQPSRAAELSASTLRNTVSGERSVYILNREVMIIQRYHKGLTISGQHRLIARFLPPELTLDFVIYAALVRPAQEFFFTQLQRGGFTSGRSGEGDALFYYLFSTTEQGRLNGKGCRAAINMNFVRCGNRLSVRTYRHVAIAFMEKNITSTRSNQDMFDFQAAHAPATASTLYSRSTTDPYFMSRDDMAEFVSCSHQWHKLLGPGNSTSTNCYAPSDQSEIIPRRKSSPTAPVQQISRFNQPALHGRPITVVVPTFSFFTIGEAVSSLLPEHFGSARILLRSFLRDQTASFRSREQCVATTLVLQSVSNLLVVLPTNGGKSLLFHLAAFSDSARVVIVVVPLVALLLDSLRKTEQLGIKCCEYQHDTSPFTALPSILFVRVTYLEHQHFRTFLLSLQEQDKLSRIFFDEAHLAMTSQDYRRCMSSVYVLSSISVQKTLLTATLPPTWENDLMTIFGFPFVTVRTPTVRASIRYEVVELLSNADMMKACLSLIKLPMAHPDKGIVFALTKPKVEEIANYLERHTSNLVARYHSGMTFDERKNNLSLWKSCNCSYIVATCGLGQGVDYPNVRTVLHFGLAHSLTDYAQETGRSGRDGQPAKCVTIYSETYFQRFSKHLTVGSSSNKGEYQALSTLRAFLLDKTRCRRQRLQEAMDGSGFPCTVDDVNELCDVCSRAMGDDQNKAPIAPASRSIRLQCAEANTRVLNDERVYMLLQEMIFNDESTHCVVCWVSNPAKFIYHLPEACPHQTAYCLKCLGAHPVHECENHLIFGSRYPSCFFCGVPIHHAHWKNDLHFGSKPGSSCNSRLRGRMIPGAWRFYDVCRARASSRGGMEGEIALLTRQEFAQWLVKVPTGSSFTNLCILWAYIRALFSG